MHSSSQKNRKVSNYNYQTHSNDPKSSIQLCNSLCNRGELSKSCSKTLLAEVCHVDSPHLMVRCYVIIDEQSNSSFIDPKLISLLGVDGPIHDYSLTTMAGHKSHHMGALISGLQVRGVREKKVHSLPSLYASTFVPDSKHEVASTGMVRSIPHLSCYA